jgi:protein-S-isoprenylcysteine O-methyltransferase Ste14
MRYVLLVVLFEVLIGALLFGTAGRVDLPWVWGLLGVHGSTMVGMLWSIDPGLRRERMGRREGGPDRWMRVMVMAWVLVHLAVAGLDVRFSWSPGMSGWVKACGLLVYTAAMVMIVRAMVVNRFFAPCVRIQAERGHETVSDGPYRFLRHPGYAGMLVAALAECFVIGSLWAMVPVAGLAAVLVWRTAREDRMLREGLAGYAEYARRVRWRLVPAVW